MEIKAILSRGCVRRSWEFEFPMGTFDQTSITINFIHVKL